MAVVRPNAERLVHYLEQLSPEIAGFLIREIELHRHAGRDDPIYGLILDAAREVVRSSEQTIPRLVTPLRKFCDPFADMLVSQTWSARSRGRISRQSIIPVWNWLTSGHAPHDLSEFASALAVEAQRDSHEAVGKIERELVALGAEAIEKAVELADRSDRQRMRLEALLGGHHVLCDAIMMATAIRAADAVRTLRAALPKAIGEPEGPVLRGITAAMKNFISAAPGAPIVGFATLVSRCHVPTTALRIAVAELRTDDASRLAQGGFGPLGDLLLGDIDIAAHHLDWLLRNRADVPTILAVIAAFSRAVEGFRLEVDIDARSEWGVALAASRRVASQALEQEIRKVAEAVNGLYRPYMSRRGGRISVDPDVVSRDLAVRALSICRGCRPFLEDLSVHEAVMRCEEFLQSRFTAMREVIHEDLRRAGDGERERVKLWFDSVVALTRAANGERDADLLARAGRVASHVGQVDAERKTGTSDR